MACSLVAGAALGAPFAELLKVVISVIKTTTEFKSLLQRLESTLTDIHPTILEVTELNKILDHHTNDETSSFRDLLERGKTLILKCCSIKCWNVYKKYSHSKKLLKLETTILKFFQIQAQAQLSSLSRRTLIGVHHVTKQNDLILSAVTNRFGVSGSCSVPELPGRLIGLDSQVEELKGMLLKDNASVVVLSAPGGCGKTTLAKMLCHDEEIRDKFGDNIFYVTVSQKTNLRVIVKKLFEHHCPERMNEFQTDEEAKNQLENLMKQLRAENILLVLDDVWSGSESIVQNLKFNIPGYKILVTSRSVFRRFSSTYKLEMLNDEDAKTLFCFSAFPNDGVPSVPDGLVNDVVKGCKGFPLALTVIGASLCGQPVLKWRSTLKKWSKGQSIFDSSSDLLCQLQTSIDALDEMLKDCYLDLGSFPEDHRIAATALMDMWTELYKLDEEDMDTLDNLHELSTRNLITLIRPREDASEDCYDHYVMQHDLLRELAIHLTNQEPIEQRKKLILDISGNEFPSWWTEQTRQPLKTRLLSISTDDAFSSSWYDMHLPEVEVLILNFQTRNYTLPEFMERLQRLNVLIITNCGFRLSELQNFHLIGCLSNLRRIRFERVSVSSLDKTLELRNLQKISFIMCELGNAFEDSSMDIPHMLPNLLELEIDRCDDLKQLPAGLCNLPHLKKLSITYCHELEELPEGLGSLKSLEILRLHSCTILEGLPESIGSLCKLRFLDISDCLNITKLPLRMGEMSGLRTLSMSGCRGLESLPMSIRNLRELEDVICDEETSYLWRGCGGDISNLKISVVEEDTFANLMKVIANNIFLDR